MSIIDTYNFIKTAQQMAKAKRAEAQRSALDNKVKFPRPGSEYLPLPAYTVTITHHVPDKTPTVIRCYMPEELTLDFSSEYSTPFAELGGSLAAFNNISRVFGGKLGANIMSMHVWDGNSPLEVTIPIRLVAFSSTDIEVLEKVRRLTAMVVPEADTPGASGQLVSVGFIKSPGPRIKFNLPNTDNAVDAANAAKSSGSNIATATKQFLSNPSGQAFVELLGKTIKSTSNGINEVLKSIEIENKVSIRFGGFSYIDSIVVKRVSSAYDLKFDEYEQPIEATVDFTFSSFLNPLSSDIAQLIGQGRSTNKSSTSPSNYPVTEVKDGKAVQTKPPTQPTGTKPATPLIDYNPQHIKYNSNGEVVA